MTKYLKIENSSIFWIICFLFGWIFTLSADLSDHLKKCENKTAHAGIKNIDFIYLINLDQRPEKLKRTCDQLSTYGIYPYRFSAVNGWELTIDAINDVGVKYYPEMSGEFMATCYHDSNFLPSHEIIQNVGQNYFGHCMSRGAIGIALSHISILQDAFDSGYETIWIMEDDIDVIRSPHILSDLIEKLDSLDRSWDVLFTDVDIHDNYGNYYTTYYAGRRPDYISTNNFSLKNKISEDFIKVGARSGAHSMILRRSGVKKLLQYFKAHQIFLPYDMEYILPSGIRLYTVAQDVVSNIPRAPSDNGGPNYLDKR
jgi:GR25 family glycosyltransferase involved in LPS biosynthesis